MDSKLVIRSTFYVAVGFILVACLCGQFSSAETIIEPITINITKPEIITFFIPTSQVTKQFDFKPRDGYLWDVFNSIWQTTGVFPDEKNSDSQLIIWNPTLNTTFHIDWTGIGNGVAVVTYHGGGNKGNLDAWGVRFHLKRVHGERVTFSTKYSAGIGSGPRNGSLVFTGDWLDSMTHAFRIIVHKKALFFGNELSHLCIVAGPEDGDQLRTVTCNENDNNQRWQICWDFNTCWPRDAVENIDYLSI